MTVLRPLPGTALPSFFPRCDEVATNLPLCGALVAHHDAHVVDAQLGLIVVNHRNRRCFALEGATARHRERALLGMSASPTFGRPPKRFVMRRIIASLFVLSPLTWGAGALAQDTAPTTATTTTTADPAGPSTTGTTVTTPLPTSTTTTTQAAVDVPAPVATPVAPATESGGSETTTFVNRPLLATGLLFFGGTYAASAGVAAESSRPSDRPNLYYPVVGPSMNLAQRDCTAARPCVGEAGNKTLLVLDGVTQGVGALAAITSFFIPEKKSRHWFIIGNDAVHPEPVSVGSGYGLAAVGRF